MLVQDEARHGNAAGIRIARPDVARDVRQPHLAGRSPAAFAVDEPMRAVGSPPHLDRLQETEQADRIAQGLELVVLYDATVLGIRDDGRRR